MPVDNYPAPGVPYFTPAQSPPAGTAQDPQPNGKPLPNLFKPLTIRGVTFQNRIWLSPLCQYSAKDGFVQPWHDAHLGGIFTRGPGLTMIEATAIEPQGRITPWDVGVWSDEHIEGLSKITQFAHTQGQKIAIQLAHAGRKASNLPPWAGAIVAEKEVGGWPDDVWGPSTLPFHPTYCQPKELTHERIQQIVQGWADAAKRSIKAGFDVIEIHSAHGYLLSSFLSPQSNKRTDQYGGSFENRIRLLVEVVDAVRAAIPESTPLFVRVSGTEWLEEILPNEPSWRAEDTARLATVLADHGVDLLDVSSGGNNAQQKIRPGKAYQAPLAEAAKKAVGSKMFVSAVGGLYNGKVAEEVLQKGMADVIFVGRMFQKNPGMVWQMADDLAVEIKSAHQIGWGFKGRAKQALGEDVGGRSPKL